MRASPPRGQHHRHRPLREVSFYVLARGAGAGAIIAALLLERKMTDGSDVALVGDGVPEFEAAA